MGRKKATARDRLSALIPAAQLKRLDDLVAGHRSKDLRASWKLGKLAAEVLEQAGTSEDTIVALRWTGYRWPWPEPTCWA